jgi:hypothetical protein
MYVGAPSRLFCDTIKTDGSGVELQIRGLVHVLGHWAKVLNGLPTKRQVCCRRTLQRPPLMITAAKHWLAYVQMSQ